MALLLAILPGVCTFLAGVLSILLAQHLFRREGQGGPRPERAPGKEPDSLSGHSTTYVPPKDQIVEEGDSVAQEDSSVLRFHYLVRKYSGQMLSSSTSMEGVRLIGWLGKGSFSNVYRAQWGATEMALKVCKVNTLERMERILAMEAAISFGARHPNVVTTYVYAVTHKKQLWKHKKDQGYGDLATGKQKQADLTEPDIPTLESSSTMPKSESAVDGEIRDVWEAKLLQECCDLGTLRDAIKDKRLQKALFQAQESNNLNLNLIRRPTDLSTAFGLMPSQGSSTMQHMTRGCDKLFCKMLPKLEYDFEGSLPLPWDQSLLPINRRANKQDMEMVVSLALDVVEGMCYLHSKGIIHGDIKASNVLLKAIVVDGEQRAQAKIADFGTSVVLKDGKEVSKFFAGTPTHMAPEVLSTSTVSQASDVYSFAILLYEMVTGRRPYPGLSTNDIMYGVVHHKLRPRMPGDIPRPILQLMNICWHQDADRRPTFLEVRSKLQDIRMEQINNKGAHAAVMQGARLTKHVSLQRSKSLLNEKNIQSPPSTSSELSIEMRGSSIGRRMAPRRVKSGLALDAKSSRRFLGHEANQRGQLKKTSTSIYPGSGTSAVLSTSNANSNVVVGAASDEKNVKISETDSEAREKPDNIPPRDSPADELGIRARDKSSSVSWKSILKRPKLLNRGVSFSNRMLNRISSDKSRSNTDDAQSNQHKGFQHQVKKLFRSTSMKSVLKQRSSCEFSLSSGRAKPAVSRGPPGMMPESGRPRPGSDLNSSDDDGAKIMNPKGEKEGKRHDPPRARDGTPAFSSGAEAGKSPFEMSRGAGPTGPSSSEQGFASTSRGHALDEPLVYIPGSAFKATVVSPQPDVNKKLRPYTETSAGTHKNSTRNTGKAAQFTDFIGTADLACSDAVSSEDDLLTGGNTTDSGTFVFNMNAFA